MARINKYRMILKLNKTPWRIIDKNAWIVTETSINWMLPCLSPLIYTIIKTGIVYILWKRDIWKDKEKSGRSRVSIQYWTVLPQAFGLDWGFAKVITRTSMATEISIYQDCVLDCILMGLATILQVVRYLLWYLKMWWHCQR